MTGLDLIQDAMKLIQALAPGETPDAGEAADALRMANNMLGQWSIQRLAVMHFLTEQLAWPAGQASRTLGPGGQLNTARPVRIESLTATDAGGTTQRVRPIDSAQYWDIRLKTVGATFPESFFFDAANPIGTLYVYPVPSGPLTFNMTSWAQFVTLVLAVDYALPPGYNEAIVYNLAMRLAALWGRPLRQDVKDLADESLDRLKTLNIQVPSVISDLDAYGNPGFNILAGA